MIFEEKIRYESNRLSRKSSILDDNYFNNLGKEDANTLDDNSLVESMSN